MTLKDLEIIYLKYYPILIVYGRNFTLDEQLIEDTIQELFLILLQKQEALIIHSPAEHYLFVSFRNNLIRKLKEQPLLPLDTDVAEEEGPKHLPENEKQLKQLLDKLPPSQREVLFLRYYQNLSYLEIAEIQGISYQVARNFAHRAIQFLKKNMKKLYSVMLAVL